MTELFEMALGELLGRVARGLQALPSTRGLLAQLAAPSGRGAAVIEAQLARRIGIVLKRDGRLRHFKRILQHAELALVAHPMMLERLDHFELQPTRVVRL